MTELEQIADAQRKLDRALAAIEQANVAIARNNLVLVTNEVAALIAWVTYNVPGIQDTLVYLGLAVQTQFDPSRHCCPGAEPGDPYIEYTRPLIDVLDHGRQHLGPVNGKLN